jgi:hypothetical protein
MLYNDLVRFAGDVDAILANAFIPPHNHNHNHAACVKKTNYAFI